MPGKIVLRFELTLQAPVSQVFRAFTNKVGFEEWLCDFSFNQPSTGWACVPELEHRLRHFWSLH